MKRKFFWIKLPYRESPQQLITRSFTEFQQNDNNKEIKERLNVYRFRDMRECVNKTIKERKELITRMISSHFLYAVAFRFELLTLGEQIEFTMLFNDVIRSNAENIVSNYMDQSEGHILLELIINKLLRKEYTFFFSSMFCSCIQHHSLLIYYLNHLYLLQRILSCYVDTEEIDIQNDILMCLEELCLNHEESGQARYAIHFFQIFYQVVQCKGKVFQRKGLSLFYQYLTLPTTPLLLFLDHVNNLMPVLPFLLSSDSVIAVAAYNILKLFVCKPFKDSAVHKFLFVNRQKLIMIVCSIPYDPNDMHFLDERKTVVALLQKMLPQPLYHPVPSK